MKTFFRLMAACLLVSSGVHAQFARTYYSHDASGRVPATGIDMVDAGNGTSCVLETRPSISMYGSYSTLGISLKKLDFNGNIIFETYYVPSGSVTATPYDLIHTPNDEYIVVGTGTTTNGNGVITRGLFAARFNNTGNFLWMKMYTSSGTYPTLGGLPGAFNRVSVARVEDGGDDSYIITAPGEQVYTTMYNQDLTLHALRISGTGAVLWNKFYAMPSSLRNGTYAYDPVFYDGPYCITYGNDGTGGKYMISGPREHAMPLTSTRDNAFCISIDRSGNMIDAYRTMDIPTYSFGQNIIYDASASQFIMSYTMADNNLVGLPTASEIAIARFDFAGLAHNRTDYYYTDSATENYGLGICQNAPQDAYVVACYVAKNTEGATSLTSYANMAMLKVDKATAAPLAWNRYHVNTATNGATAAISHTDPATLTENYVMAGNPNTHLTVAGPSGPLTYSIAANTRVISTDVMGNTCGAFSEPINTAQYTPVFTPYPYQVTALPGIAAAITLLPATFPSELTDCTGAPSPDDYRKVNTAFSKTAVLNVYPTCLYNNDREVKLDVTVPAATVLDVALYDMEGRLLGTQKLSLVEGANKLSWQLPLSLPGNYLLQATAADGSVKKVSRIVKL